MTCKHYTDEGFDEALAKASDPLVTMIRIYRGEEVINGTWCSTLGRARKDAKVLVRCFEATHYELESTTKSKALKQLRRIAMKSSEVTS